MMNTSRVYWTFIEFREGGAGKRRPILVVDDGNGEYAFKITSKFANNSEFIQSMYFELLDWEAVHLPKKSWVDTMTKLDMAGIHHLRYIGKLSVRDQNRLAQFLLNQ